MTPIPKCSRCTAQCSDPYSFLSCALTCTDCYTRYYPDSIANNVCKLCLPDVAHCVDCTNSTFCTWCQTGYYLGTTAANNQICLACTGMSGCLECINGLICTKCASTYYLSMNSCILCSATLSNCLTCSSATVCLSCASGLSVNLSPYTYLC